MKFCKEIMIGNRAISVLSPVFIIAEAGVNHNGDMPTAKRLIDAAYEAGADAVKFQTFNSEHLILKTVPKAPYQTRTTDTTESQFNMLKSLELNQEQHLALRNYCQERGIIFLSTPFESESLKSVVSLNVAAIKIAATDLTNIQYLYEVAQAGKPIILSAGMCYLEEVERALAAIHKYNREVILLHCTANYPVADEEINLRVLTTFQEKFDIMIGYSDHSAGVGAAPYAVALGAKVIEKHFTLDKNMRGPDHKASILPEELCELVHQVRRVEKYLGNPQKLPTFSEQQTRNSLQKCFVAKRAIAVGETFGADNITAKRTGGIGIAALYYDEIVGQKTNKPYHKDEILIDIN